MGAETYNSEYFLTIVLHQIHSNVKVYLLCAVCDCEEYLRMLVPNSSYRCASDATGTDFSTMWLESSSSWSSSFFSIICIHRFRLAVKQRFRAPTVIAKKICVRIHFEQRLHGVCFNSWLVVFKSSVYFKDYSVESQSKWPIVNCCNSLASGVSCTNKSIIMSWTVCFQA